MSHHENQVRCLFDLINRNLLMYLHISATLTSYPYQKRHPLLALSVTKEIKSMSAYYNGKITRFVLLSSVIAATGGLIFGYGTGVTGGVASTGPFLKKFFPAIYRKMKEGGETTSNYCKFDSQLLTFFTSSFLISGLVSTFFASPVTRALGRKASIFIGGVAFITGSVLGGAAENIYMLICSRLLLGIGFGFTNQSVPLYLSEMAPPQHRGAFNFGFQLCVGSGGLIALLVNYGTEKITGGWGWRVSLGLAAIPALILTVSAPFLPETPNSLVQQGNQEKAKKMLQKIRGTDDVEAEFDDLITASNASTTINHPFKKIFERKYRPQLVMSVAIPFFQQVTGINLISFYAPMLFLTIGSGVSASLMSSVIVGTAGTIMTVLSLLVVDKVGRRALFHIGGIQILIPQLMIGAIMAAKLGDHGILSQGYGVSVLILMCIYAIGFSSSWGPLAWLVTSEIFSLEIRSAGQSINVATSFLISFVLAQTFLAMLCHFKAAIFFFFALWAVLMTGFVYVFLPETKDVPIEKMEKIWKEHWFWKRFVGDGDHDEYEGNKTEEA
ncbi:UNVERIFIED_CONTAM: Hexose carrier protein HEX6 [Sesamum radiatum]|uniref:Hexose carrier protein HEX6 n=1 Tax=Sesamum radiatum TaxID=300843 RepID=A0AAW2JUX3_SESRA